MISESKPLKLDPARRTHMFEAALLHHTDDRSRSQGLSRPLSSAANPCCASDLCIRFPFRALARGLRRWHCDKTSTLFGRHLPQIPISSIQGHELFLGWLTGLRGCVLVFQAHTFAARGVQPCLSDRTVQEFRVRYIIVDHLVLVHHVSSRYAFYTPLVLVCCNSQAVFFLQCPAFHCSLSVLPCPQHRRHKLTSISQSHKNRGWLL